MTIEEAKKVKVGDEIIYITDDYNDNPIELNVKVRQVYKDLNGPTHFDVKVIKDKKTFIDNAFAPISLFKFK